MLYLFRCFLMGYSAVLAVNAAQTGSYLIAYTTIGCVFVLMFYHRLADEFDRSYGKRASRSFVYLLHLVALLVLWPARWLQWALR